MVDRGERYSNHDRGLWNWDRSRSQSASLLLFLDDEGYPWIPVWVCRIVHKHRDIIRSYNASEECAGAEFQLWLPLDFLECP